MRFRPWFITRTVYRGSKVQHREKYDGSEYLKLDLPIFHYQAQGRWRFRKSIYVHSFLLQKRKDYLKSRKFAWNIIDWAEDKRLDEIQATVDRFLHT